MPKLGSEFGQGNKDETAFRQAGMRNFDSVFVNHFRSIEKNIEVDDSRPARDKFPAPELSFDGLEAFKQFPRRQRCFRLDDAI
jgi:hypothetical protein